MSKLSEVDKLIQKIDSIYNDLGGESDPNYFDVSKVKDKYDRLRVEINRNITEIEVLLNEKDNVKQENLNEKYKIDAKVEDKLISLKEQLKQFEIEMKSQKKKSTNEDIAIKQQLVESFNKRYLIIKNRHEGIEVNATEANENVLDIDNLESKLKKYEGGPQREMYQEEKDKIGEYDVRVKKQDELINQIGVGVKELKADARQIGKQIGEVNKAVDKTKNKSDKTEEKLVTTNKKLKDLLEKLRGSDKICVDIVLVCVCLGLAAVLYNLIKNYL